MATRRRALWAGGEVGLIGRPTVGGSAGHNGPPETPAPEAGAVTKLRSANNGPDSTTAVGATAGIWLAAGPGGPTDADGFDWVGVCNTFCVISDSTGARQVRASAGGSSAGVADSGTSTRGISSRGMSTGGVAAGADRSQIGGFGRSGSEPVNEEVGGCSTVVNLWVECERYCKAKRKFC